MTVRASRRSRGFCGTYSHLIKSMIARTASTALCNRVYHADVSRGRDWTYLFSVTTNRSPRSFPRYSNICSPPQSNMPSRGMIAKKQTGGVHVVGCTPRKEKCTLTNESRHAAPCLVPMRNPRERNDDEQDIEPWPKSLTRLRQAAQKAWSLTGREYDIPDARRPCHGFPSFPS